MINIKQRFLLNYNYVYDIIHYVHGNNLLMNEGKSHFFFYINLLNLMFSHINAIE